MNYLSIALQIISPIFKLVKRYPWLILVFIFVIYIGYLHLQIYSYKNDIKNVNEQLTTAVFDSINAYQTFVSIKNKQEDMIKILSIQKDSVSKELLKLIKTKKYKINEVTDIKFKESKYSTGDTLQDGTIEKVEDQFKIKFSKKFDNAFIEGYVLYPSAKFKLDAIFKPSDMKIVKVEDNNGLERIFAYPFSGSNIESINISSTPSVVEQSFYKKFDLDATVTYKSYNMLSGELGLNVWKLKPIVGVDIIHNDKSYIFYGLEFKLF